MNDLQEIVVPVTIIFRICRFKILKIHTDKESRIKKLILWKYLAGS